MKTNITFQSDLQSDQESSRTSTSDIKEAFQGIWQYRELLYQLVLRDVRIRYKQAIMGFGWAIFMPALVILAGIVVKYAMASLAGKPLETGSIAGVALKALPWSFFVGSINFSTNSLTGNMNLVTKIYFPREVLPLSATLAQTIDTLIGALALLLILPFLGAKLSITWFWMPLVAILLFSFTVAMAFLLSCANLFFRDVKYIVQVLLTFGIFFTPVFFEPAVFGTIGAYIMMLNPLSPLLEGLRLCIIEGHNLLLPLTMYGENGSTIVVWSPLYLVYSLIISISCLFGSIKIFHKMQYLFAEYI